MDGTSSAESHPATELRSREIAAFSNDPQERSFRIALKDARFFFVIQIIFDFGQGNKILSVFVGRAGGPAFYPNFEIVDEVSVPAHSVSDLILHRRISRRPTGTGFKSPFH